MIDVSYSAAEVPSSATKAGAVQIPIRHADGTTTSISSSTMDAQELKEFRDKYEAQSGGSTWHTKGSLKVDIRKI